MPYVWFRCRGCGQRLHRWCNAKHHHRGPYICDRLVRCDPPPDYEPGSPAWLEQRAMQAAFARS